MNTFARIGLTFFVVLIASLCVLSQGKSVSKGKSQSKPLSAQEIAKRFLPSVVLIVCDDGKGRLSQGSGFFVKVKKTSPPPIGYLKEGNISDFVPYTEEQRKGIGPYVSWKSMILTNFHVVDSMVRGKVKLSIGGKEASEWWIESIVGVDRANDLALLELKDKMVIDLDKPVGGMSFVPPKTPDGLDISRLNEPRIGEDIFVLSNPEGLTGTISKGIISGGIRKINGIDLLQIDAPISSGSSGGAVLDAYGDVIAIATGSLREGQNLNFAVPASTIQLFISGYDARSKDLHFDQATVENGWQQARSSGPKLGSANIGQSSTIDRDAQKQKPNEDPRRSKSPNLSGSTEEITNWLADNMRNVEAMNEKVTARITNLSLSQCNLNLSTSISSEGLTAKQKYSTHLSNVKSVSPVGTGDFRGIRLTLNERIAEEKAWSDSEVDYSLIDRVFVPSKPESQIDTGLAFEVLRQRCANDSNARSSSEKPNMVETTKWLTNRIEGTSEITGSIMRKYQSLKFAACQMRFVESTRFEGSETQRTYTPNLRSLKNVNAGKNASGDWGIWLDFHENFYVMNETFGHFGRKETERKDKITIFVDSFEKANRIASAFARLLELCGEEKKEPF